MTTSLALGEITIHPVIEQQGAFFDALSFFPKLAKNSSPKIGTGCSRNLSMPKTSWFSASRAS